MLIEILFTIFLFMFGTVIGSFLNVCIYRIPRGESLMWPGSHCPRCGRPIKAYDNIPLLSFIILKGRCRYCQEKISFRYPLVEGMTGLAFVIVLLSIGLTFCFIPALLLTAILIAISFIDIDHQIIPNVIVIPGIVLGVLLSLLPEEPSILDSLRGLLIGGGLLLIIALVSRGKMGGGDIKLAAMLGAFLGWKTNLVGMYSQVPWYYTIFINRTILALFLAFFLGGIVGVIWMIVYKKGLKEAVPYGPMIALGGFLSLIWGEAIIKWYVGLLRF